MRTFHFDPDEKEDGDIEIPSPPAPWMTLLLAFISQVREEGLPPSRGQSERMVSGETGTWPPRCWMLDVVCFFAKQTTVALPRRDSGPVSAEPLVSGAGSPIGWLGAQEPLSHSALSLPFGVFSAPCPGAYQPLQCLEASKMITPVYGS